MRWQRPVQPEFAAIRHDLERGYGVGGGQGKWAGLANRAVATGAARQLGGLLLPVVRYETQGQRSLPWLGMDVRNGKLSHTNRQPVKGGRVVPWLIARRDKRALTIQHALVLGGDDWDRQPAAVETARERAGLAITKSGVHCAGGREPVADQIGRGLEAQRAVTLDDELSVVARQREHDRAFALGIVMRAGHRLF